MPIDVLQPPGFDDEQLMFPGNLPPGLGYQQQFGKPGAAQLAAARLFPTIAGVWALQVVLKGSTGIAAGRPGLGPDQRQTQEDQAGQAMTRTSVAGGG